MCRMSRHTSTNIQNESSGFWKSAEFAARLKEERRRVGANQTAFAALGGATLDSQSRYENGKNQPAAEYLAGLAHNGVDVLYLLTGQRMVSPLLSQEATQLLDAFEKLNAETQKAALAVLQAMSRGIMPAPPAAPALHETQDPYEAVDALRAP
jgi:transcriptional regulator with XRE-family HTH domain